MTYANVTAHVSGWAAVTKDNCDIHVIPVDDIRPHDASSRCFCHPVPDEEDERVIVHNSLDRREIIERGEAAVQ